MVSIVSLIAIIGTVDLKPTDQMRLRTYDVRLWVSTRMRIALAAIDINMTRQNFSLT